MPHSVNSPARRALLLVLDSVGCGSAADAENYGDEGADTLGHIQKSVPELRLKHLAPENWSAILEPQSPGKDTTTGHWELAGVTLEKPFATFEKFPPELVEEIEKAANVQFLGNIAASGTQILVDLGSQHVSSGQPILYTSADSVLQIAAHEEIFGLERLYEICKIARKIADRWQIGRVIARPFVGENGNWTRTANRKDFSLVPPQTVLNRLQNAGIKTVGIGKISDIFANSGLDESHPTKSNADGMATIERLWKEREGGLIFANLVDFDTLYGHRRDPHGYARALEDFESWFDNFLPQIGPDDLVLVTADHGNDPTWRGTDHTRENVPLLAFRGHEKLELGQQKFGFVAQIIEEFLRPS